MDIEKQFEEVFSKITLDNGQPLVSVEPEIVHGCVVNNDFAKITLILPDDSPLRGSLPAQVEAEIKKITKTRLNDRTSSSWKSLKELKKN